MCSGSGAVITLSSPTLNDGTYTVTYNLGGGNTATGSTASMTVSGGTGTFTTSNLTNATTSSVTTNVTVPTWHLVHVQMQLVLITQQP